MRPKRLDGLVERFAAGATRVWMRSLDRALTADVAKAVKQLRHEYDQDHPPVCLSRSWTASPPSNGWHSASPSLSSTAACSPRPLSG
jgi:hypothetical protein